MRYSITVFLFLCASFIDAAPVEIISLLPTLKKRNTVQNSGGPRRSSVLPAQFSTSELGSNLELNPVLQKRSPQEQEEATNAENLNEDGNQDNTGAGAAAADDNNNVNNNNNDQNEANVEANAAENENNNDSAPNADAGNNNNNNDQNGANAAANADENENNNNNNNNNNAAVNVDADNNNNDQNGADAAANADENNNDNNNSSNNNNNNNNNSSNNNNNNNNNNNQNQANAGANADEDNANDNNNAADANADNANANNNADADAGAAGGGANGAGFCNGQTLADGTQQQDSTCSVTVQGTIPAVANMVSTLITSPADGSVIQAGEEVTVSVSTLNMDLGFFDDPDTEYYNTPQTLNGQGIIEGHQHIIVQNMGNGQEALNPDPDGLTFFQGLDGQDINGVLETVIPADTITEPGTYRFCTITGTRGHQPVIMPVARRGAQDDCIRVTVQ